MDASITKLHIEPTERAIARAMPRELAAIVANPVSLGAFHRTLRQRTPSVVRPLLTWGTRAGEIALGGARIRFCRD